MPAGAAASSPAAAVGAAAPSIDVPVSSPAAAAPAPAGKVGGADESVGLDYTRGAYEREIDTFGCHKLKVTVPGGGPSELAKIVSLHCSRHADLSCVRAGRRHAECRANLTLTMTEAGPDLEDCIVKLKRWCVQGYAIQCRCPEIVLGGCDHDRSPCSARTQHMAISRRRMSAPPSKELLDRLVREKHFTESEVSCLR